MWIFFLVFCSQVLVDRTQYHPFLHPTPLFSIFFHFHGLEICKTAIICRFLIAYIYCIYVYRDAVFWLHQSTDMYIEMPFSDCISRLICIIVLYIHISHMSHWHNTFNNNGCQYEFNKTFWYLNDGSWYGSKEYVRGVARIIEKRSIDTSCFGGGGPRAAQMSPWGEVYNIHQLPYPSRQAHVCEKLDSHSSPIVDLTHDFTCLIALKDLSFVARHCQ